MISGRLRRHELNPFWEPCIPGISARRRESGRRRWYIWLGFLGITLERVT